MTPLVSCLTATHGRFIFLQEAVSCFLQQDYKNKELIILNNHSVSLQCDLPQVRIYNEPGYPSLGDCRNRLLDLAKGDYVRTWDDDDLYMPWAISQGVEQIGNHPAWKPKYSWSWRVDRDQINLNGNKYEASWTTRSEVARRFGYLGLSGGNEHNSLEWGLKEVGGIASSPVKASYVYRWGSTLCRISGSLNKTDLTEETTRRRTERWQKLNNDTGDGNPIEPVDLSGYWQKFETEWEKQKGQYGLG